MPSHTIAERRKRGLPGPKKAGKILRHGSVHGNPLSTGQKGLFGLIRGGGTPTRLSRHRRRKSGT